MEKADGWTDTKSGLFRQGMAERGQCWFSCSTISSRQSREGREILRGVVDLGENSEAKSLVVSWTSRSRYGGNKQMRELGNQEMTV